MEWFTLEIGGEDVECNQYNTLVYIFSGESHTRNHIYVRQDEEDGGFYIFDRPDVVQAFVMSQKYVVVYAPFVSENDEAAYYNYLVREGRIVPEDDTLTEDDINKFIEEVEADGVIGHFDELTEED